MATPRSTIRASALVGLVALLAGCSAAKAATPAASTSAAPKVTLAPTMMAAPTTTVAPGPTKAQLAAKFLALIVPVNLESNKLNAKYPNGGEQASAWTAMITPLSTFDNAVLRIGLTGQAAIDVRSLVTADDAMVNDVQTDNASALESDSALVSAADNALRADLGLPAASS
jgi:hypothetical protein